MKRGLSFAVVLSATLTGCSASEAPAQDQRPGQQPAAHPSGTHEYTVSTVVDGLVHPWSLAFLPGGDMLITERPGRLRVVRDGRLLAEPVAGVPEVWAQRQGGLLVVVPHPDFAQNRLIYLSYSKPGPEGATTAVIRGRFDGAALTNVEEIIEARGWRTAGQHFGSRLAFDRDGYLYITVGDRGQMSAAQDRSNHQGTVLRLHDDGRVPADNPFVGQEGIRPEIFTWGNRNPQSLAMHPATGEMWSAEHGPRGGDELNVLRAGANYGWPEVTYGINYNGQPISDIQQKEGIVDPVHYWVPSIATSGLAFYDGDRFPNWRGSALVGGLVGQHIARVALDGRTVTGTEKLLEGRGRVRDVRVGPDGLIYVLIDSPSAPLLKLEPAG